MLISLQMLCQKSRFTNFRHQGEVYFALQFLADVAFFFATSPFWPHILPDVFRYSYLPSNLPYITLIVIGSFGFSSPPISFVLVIDMS